MLADNWDRGSLYSYRAFSFPSEMPYEAIKQPVMFITGERDGALTKGAKKVRTLLKMPAKCCFGSLLGPEISAAILSACIWQAMEMTC